MVGTISSIDLQFQSTRLWEARHFNSGIDIYQSVFQSTRLWEARRRHTALMTATTGFNPRACGRRDLSQCSRCGCG